MDPFMEFLGILGAFTLAGVVSFASAALLKRFDLLPAKREPEARKGLRKERP